MLVDQTIQFLSQACNDTDAGGANGARRQAKLSRDFGGRPASHRVLPKGLPRGRLEFALDQVQSSVDEMLAVFTFPEFGIVAVVRQCVEGFLGPWYRH